jgi:hypothetical protein
MSFLGLSVQIEQASQALVFDDRRLWSRPTNWTACCAEPAVFRRRGKKRKR